MTDTPAPDDDSVAALADALYALEIVPPEVAATVHASRILTRLGRPGVNGRRWVLVPPPTPENYPGNCPRCGGMGCDCDPTPAAGPEQGTPAWHRAEAARLLAEAEQVRTTAADGHRHLPTSIQWVEATIHMASVHASLGMEPLGEIEVDTEIETTVEESDGMHLSLSVDGVNISVLPGTDPPHQVFEHARALLTAAREQEAAPGRSRRSERPYSHLDDDAPAQRLYHHLHACRERLCLAAHDLTGVYPEATVPAVADLRSIDTAIREIDRVGSKLPNWSRHDRTHETRQHATDPLSPTPATVTAWHVVDGGILGAVIECSGCDGIGLTRCEQCSGSGRLHVPYRTPGGGIIDAHRHPEALAVFDQPPPAPRDPDETVPPATARLDTVLAVLDNGTELAWDRHRLAGQILTALAATDDAPLPSDSARHRSRVDTVRAHIAAILDHPDTGTGWRHATGTGIADMLARHVVAILDAHDVGDPIPTVEEVVLDDPSAVAEATTAIEHAGGLRALLDELAHLRSAREATAQQTGQLAALLHVASTTLTDLATDDDGLSEVPDHVADVVHKLTQSALWLGGDYGTGPVVIKAPSAEVFAGIRQLPSFRGTVADAGGGRVEILVARDTASYPPVGTGVTVVLDQARPNLHDTHTVTAPGYKVADAHVVEALLGNLANASTRDGNAPLTVIVDNDEIIHEVGAVLSDAIRSGRLDHEGAGVLVVPAGTLSSIDGPTGTLIEPAPPEIERIVAAAAGQPREQRPPVPPPDPNHWAGIPVAVAEAEVTDTATGQGETVGYLVRSNVPPPAPADWPRPVPEDQPTGWDRPDADPAADVRDRLAAVHGVEAGDAPDDEAAATEQPIPDPPADGPRPWPGPPADATWPIDADGDQG